MVQGLGLSLTPVLKVDSTFSSPQPSSVFPISPLRRSNILLDILGHDGHPLGVDGADVGVLEQPHQIRPPGEPSQQSSGSLGQS